MESQGLKTQTKRNSISSGWDWKDFVVQSSPGWIWPFCLPRFLEDLVTSFLSLVKAALRNLSSSRREAREKQNELLHKGWGKWLLRSGLTTWEPSSCSINLAPLFISILYKNVEMHTQTRAHSPRLANWVHSESLYVAYLELQNTFLPIKGYKWWFSSEAATNAYLFPYVP